MQLYETGLWEIPELVRVDSAIQNKNPRGVAAGSSRIILDVGKRYITKSNSYYLVTTPLQL